MTAPKFHLEALALTARTTTRSIDGPARTPEEKHSSGSAPSRSTIGRRDPRPTGRYRRAGGGFGTATDGADGRGTGGGVVDSGPAKFEGSFAIGGPGGGSLTRVRSAT